QSFTRGVNRVGCHARGRSNSATLQRRAGADRARHVAGDVRNGVSFGGRALCPLYVLESVTVALIGAGRYVAEAGLHKGEALVGESERRSVGEAVEERAACTLVLPVGWRCCWLVVLLSIR